MAKRNSGMRASVITTVLALVLAAGATIMGRVETKGTDDASATPVAHADPVQKWLIKGDRPASKAAADASPPQAWAPPRTEAAGALVDRSTALGLRLAPAGSKRLSAVQYPGLRAATATFSAGDRQMSLTLSRFSAPGYVSDFTMGFPEDTYQEWPNGMQAVIVRHALPDTFQVVVVRDKGVLLSVTVTGSPTFGKADILSAWSGVDQFVQRVKDLANDQGAAIDGFAAD